jgi:hypothetical protein
MEQNPSKRRVAPGRIGRLVAALVLAAAVLPTGAQAAVEYVKICPNYGDEYHYLPGTDYCLNASTNDVRTETAGGTWRWRMPNNPIQWIQAPRKICRGGRLIEFGTLNNSNLVLNAYSRLESATMLPFSLADKEYVSSVIYRGDLVPAPEMCLFYHYVDVVDGSVYQPLGCATPSANLRYPALLSYTPDIQPPDTTNPLFLVAASGRPGTPDPSTITGSLDIWLCIKKAKSAQ